MFYARNIDQLLLAMVARLLGGSRAPVVYEVLDIPPILMRQGISAALLRWIERRCLEHVRLLALSSPAFHRNYYAAIQHHRGPWFLVENKLHPSIARIARPTRPRPVRGGRPWVVGYFGLIRGEDTFALMARLAERLQGRVQFVFRGALTTVDPARFRRDAEAAAEHDLRRSLPAPQRSRDALSRGRLRLGARPRAHRPQFALADALPVLRGGYFGVPCLAVRDFQVGSVVEQHGIGFTFDQPLEERLVRFFETLTVADYERICAELARMPDDMFVAGDDVAKLCAPDRRLQLAAIDRLIITQSNSISRSERSRLTG